MSEVDHIEQMIRAELTGEIVTPLLSRVDWRKVTTALILERFRSLGHQLGYHVAPGPVDGRHHGGWLYDMCWFVSAGGVMTRLVMALESETKPGNSVAGAADVDGDFQKLVQVRAEVRVWFALLPTPDLRAKHLANCKRQIAAFPGSVEGDIYLLALYDWTDRRTHVTRIVWDGNRDTPV